MLIVKQTLTKRKQANPNCSTSTTEMYGKRVWARRRESKMWHYCTKHTHSIELWAREAERIMLIWVNFIYVDFVGLSSVLFCSVSSLIKTHAEKFTKMKYTCAHHTDPSCRLWKDDTDVFIRNGWYAGRVKKSRDLHWSKSIGRSCQSTIAFFLPQFVRSFACLGLHMLARYIYSILGLKIYS